MKKVLCIVICMLTAFCFVGCKEEAQESAPILIELMSKTPTDEYDFAIVDDKGTVWIENSDVSSVHIMYKKGQNRYLELRFTEEGTKKFKKAVKMNKKGILSIMVDGEILVSPVTVNEENSEYAIADSVYEDVIGWFNKLT